MFFVRYELRRNVLQVATKTDCSIRGKPQTEERVDSLNKIIERHLISTFYASRIPLLRYGEACTESNTAKAPEDLCPCLRLLTGV